MNSIVLSGNSAKSSLYIPVVLAVLMLFSYQSFGQTDEKEGQKSPGSMSHYQHNAFGIPNLSDDQKAKIKDLRLAHMKEVKPIRNQLGELKAKQHTLVTADKPDLKAIDANIDEISKVLNQLMKAGAQFKQQVRALLTDEQRLYFDSNMGKRHGFRENHEMEMRRGFEEWHHGPESSDMQR